MIRVPVTAICLLSCSALVAVTVAAAPQAAAQEVVQQLPDPATETLNDALRRLSRNPESLPALLAAGRASLDLDDVSAASGFFNRAQNVSPDDGRVLVGLALVAVRRGQPIEALEMFEQAEAAGENLAPYGADRGLAFDLVGRNDRAQRLYRESLSRRENPEVLRRLALSHAITGDAEASEAILLPLLQRQDRGAYRTRAFALAIQGRSTEAIAIAETMLPPRLSLRLAPYFRIMSQLTPAQQAAAANLGRFPDANEVGRDEPEIAALAEGRTVPAGRPPSGAARLQPRGAPLGTPQPATPPQAQAQPQTEPQREAVAELAEAVADLAEEPPADAVEEAIDIALAQPAPEPEPEPAPPAVAEIQPGFSLADIGDIVEEPEASEAEEIEEPVELAEAFADFSQPTDTVRPSAGAVDITAIEPRREAPPPPPPPAHPSRQWVQVATGQDTSAFRFDWRRIRREAGGLLDDVDVFVAPWGQTNRLLAGPFGSPREAQDLVSALAGAGVSTFRYTSSEGEEVSPL